MSVVYSYFELEDILILYADDYDLKHKLIEKYKIEHFIDDAEYLINKNYFRSIEYLVQNDYNIYKSDIKLAFVTDKLEIFKVLYPLLQSSNNMYKSIIYNYGRGAFFQHDTVNIYRYIAEECNLDIRLDLDLDDAHYFKSFKIIQYIQNLQTKFYQDLNNKFR